MNDEYTTIKVRKDTLYKLKDAAKLLNARKANVGKKYTVSGLVSLLADQYESNMDADTLPEIGEDSWMNHGVPIILNSSASKHFNELKTYYPKMCVDMVTNYIVNTASNERFERAKND